MLVNVGLFDTFFVFYECLFTLYFDWYFDLTLSQGPKYVFCTLMRFSIHKCKHKPIPIHILVNYVSNLCSS